MTTKFAGESISRAVLLGLLFQRGVSPVGLGLRRAFGEDEKNPKDSSDIALIIG